MFSSGTRQQLQDVQKTSLHSPDEFVFLHEYKIVVSNFNCGCFYLIFRLYLFLVTTALSSIFGSEIEPMLDTL